MSLFVNRRGGSNGGGGSGSGSTTVATETSMGIVKFAEPNQVAPLIAVQANDPRLNKEISISLTPPINTNVLWLDTNTSVPILKWNNTGTWEAISSASSSTTGLLGTKQVDETNITNGVIPIYDINTDEYDLSVLDSNIVLYANTSYPALDNVKKALDNILNKIYYVTPVISSFTNNINTVEKGTTIATVNLAWTINKPVTSISLNQGIGSLSLSATSHSLTSLNLTADTTYTLSVSDGTTNINSSTSVVFRQKRYWGTNVNTTLTNAEVLALSSEFSTTRVQSKTINGNGQYIYFAWPTSFGVPSFKIFGLTNTAWTQSTLTFTNASGYTESYYIYRTNTVQNASGILIDVQ